jgi:hypothetical protein
MNPELKIPPVNPDALTSPEILADKLSVLIGYPFVLTGKTRTDGSNVRKLIATILEQGTLPPSCPIGEYAIIPPKGKGVPSILREYIDTYIVTSGDKYNLQVWNRNPASESVQIEYNSGETLSARDVRFVFLRIARNEIRSILVLTPGYIEEKFGKFGKPTIKHQLIISPKKRQEILASSTKVLFYPDTPQVAQYTTDFFIASQKRIHDIPEQGELFSIEVIREKVVASLLGTTIAPASTKTRGQALEQIVANLLGYIPNATDLLAGGYPDIRHQLLEVKIQDSPTVDLGAFSPAFEETLSFSNSITTRDVRYLIALMDAKYATVQGIVLCSGSLLGEHFAYVSDTSFKSQRSIPMSFFDSYDGKVVFNP